MKKNNHFTLNMFIPFTEQILKDEQYFNDLFNCFKKLFTNISKKTNKLDFIEIEFDWNVLENAIIDFRVSKGKVKLEIPIVASCTQLDLKQINIYNLMTHYIEVIIYDIFLIMNLSHPGCFSLFNATLKVIPDYKINFGIDDIMFSTAIYKSQSRIGVEISNIKLPIVYNWYNSFSNIDNQISTNSVERSLFAILSYSKVNDIQPTSLIWLTHAIESIYNLPSSSICNTLINRINLVLNIPQLKRKNLKKRINKFYNVRSRFVHGDFSISHPIQNEILDNNVDKYIVEILDSTSDISSILLATLHKMIHNNCIELKFEESVNYIKYS